MDAWRMFAVLIDIALVTALANGQTEVRLGLLLESPHDSTMTAVNLSIEFMYREHRLLRGVNVTLVTRTTTGRNQTDAVSKVCEMMSEGISGLVTLSSCELLPVLRAQQQAFHVPHMAVYSGHCAGSEHFQDSFSLSLQQPSLAFIPALIDILSQLSWKELVLLYDNSYAPRQIQALLFSLSRLNVRSIMIKLTTHMNQYVRELDAIKGRPALPSNFLLLLSRESTELLISCATRTDLMSERNFWIIVNNDIFSLPVDDGCTYGGNVAWVSKKWPPQPCSATARFIAERHPFIQPAEAFLVDALVTVASVVCSQQSDPNGSDSGPSSLDCSVRPFVPWERGDKMLDELKQVNNTGLTGSIFFNADGYNGNTDQIIKSLKPHKDSFAFKRVGSWNAENGLRWTERIFATVPKGYNNATFIVGTKEAIPFVIKTQDENGTRFEGFCVDILHELSVLLNFRFEFREPEDGQWGAEEPDKSFNGIIGMIIEEKLDFGIGPITINAERERGIDFTTPFMEDGVGIVMKRPTEEANEIFRMFRPFHGFVWLALAGSLVAIGLCLFVLNRISHKGLSGLGADTDSQQLRHGLRESVWLMFASYMEQGPERHPISVPGRLVVGTWWLFTILMISSYTANLAAFLTVIVIDKPINNLQDLAKNEEIKPLAKPGTSIYSSLRDGKTEVAREIWKKLQDVPRVTDNAEAYEYVETGEYAFMVDKTQLEYLVKQDCETFMLADESFDNAGFGFVFPEDSPMLSQISYRIIKMQEAGLIERWRQKWWPASDECATSGPASQAKRLRLDSTGGPFIIFAATVVFAAICLAIEITCSRIRRKEMRLNEAKDPDASRVSSVTEHVPT